MLERKLRSYTVERLIQLPRSDSVRSLIERMAQQAIKPYGSREGKDIYSHPEFKYNERESCLIIKDKQVSLTPIQNQVIRLLTENTNQTVPNSTFYLKVWGVQDKSLNINLRNHIHALRQIFRQQGLRKSIIFAKRAKGYRLVDESKLKPTSDD